MTNTTNPSRGPGNSKKLFALAAAFCMASALFFPKPVYGDDQKIRHVLVISIDGMHSLDMALWVKNNPTSALAKLSAQGMTYTNANTTKPSDSIPSTLG